MGGFQFTPFPKGEFYPPPMPEIELLMRYTALDATVKWFLGEL